MRPTHFPNIQKHLDEMAQMPVVQRCLFCEWVWQGIAAEGRERAIEHRLQAHPEAIQQRRKRGGQLRTFRQQALKKEDWDEIMDDRAKRARLTGVDLVD